MRQAFLIQLHQNFAQVTNLVDEIIRTPQCEIYLHVDQKNDELHHQLQDYYRNTSKVTIINQRQSVFWGNFSQVRATLNLMEVAMPQAYDYYSLISGQDYMIKPLSEFQSFLQQHSGKEFIEARKRNNTWRVKLAHHHTTNPLFRTSRWFRYYALLLSIINYRPKKHIDGYEIYFGSSWFTLTNQAIKFILDFTKANPGFVEDFATSTCGDEHFFQVILMNSHFKSSIYNDNLRFIKFKHRQNSPDILALEDYEELAKSPQFLARKFAPGISDELVAKFKSQFSTRS